MELHSATALASAPHPAREAADDGAAEHADLVAVRAWARSRGYPIDETSGVPLPVLRTYLAVRAG